MRTTRMLWLFFFIVAVGGFAASAAVHVAAWCGVDVAQLWPNYFVIHLIWFIPLVAAIVMGKAADRRAGVNSDPFDFQSRWMRWALIALFAYATLNFGSFVFREEGTPTREPDGTYALRSKRTFIRTISLEEYHAQRALQARGASGHCMLFNGLAAGLLLNVRRDRRRITRQCNGPPRLELAR